MTFDLLERFKQALPGWKTRMEQSGTESAYAMVLASALWPVAAAAQAAVQSGDWSALMTLGGALGGGVGGNLIANQLQKWKDESDCARQIAALPEADPLREHLDALLQKLDAFTAARDALPESDRQWFRKTLCQELSALGNLAKFEIQITATQSGSGGQAVGRDNVVSGAGGMSAGRDIHVYQGAAAAKGEDPIPAYLAWLDRYNSPVRVQDIDEGRGTPDAQPLQLRSVFVDLNVTLKIESDLSLRKHLERERQRAAESQACKPFPRSLDRELTEAAREQPRETRPVTVFETVGEHSRLVLVGDAGSGKSTVGQFLTLALTRARLGDDTLRQRLGQTWQHGSLLPVPLVLRDFAARLPERHPKGRAKDVWAAFRGALEDGKGQPAWADAVQQVAETDGALFLLDGWDETHDPLRLAIAAEALADLLENPAPNSRFLLTSRPYAWDSVLLAAQGKPDPGYERLAPGDLQRLQTAFRCLNRKLPTYYQVAALEAPQVETFIQNWYRAVQEGNPPWLQAKEAAVKKTDLETAAAREDLQPVVTNPLLLTLTASLSGTHLPDDRTDLFDKIVEQLLYRWTRRSGQEKSLLEFVGCEVPHKDIRQKIQECAFAAHRRHQGQPGVADIPEFALQYAFAKLLEGDQNRARRLVEFVERRAGLLISKGLKDGCRQFACPHRAFQEFLAACHLREQSAFIASERQPKPDETPSAVALAREHAGHWTEVLCFAARLAGQDFGSIAAHILVSGVSFEEWHRSNTPTDTDWRCALLAGKQLLEIGPHKLRDGTADQRRRLEHIAGWLGALIDHGGLTTVRERVDASLVLAKLGDPRRGVGTRPFVVPASAGSGAADSLKAGQQTELPEFEWCPLPKGKLKLGETGKQANVPAFELSRYLVTVAQYESFLDDPQGYHDEQWWKDEPDAPGMTDWWRENHTQGPGNYDPVFQTPNHPRVGVCWYEAVAFCRWLTERIRNPQSAIPNSQVRLPHEAEWEWAARWNRDTGKADARVFPWRDSKADDPAAAGKCNCYETGLGHTSAVGLFPQGAADCGALDLAGNVWEWCEDWYDKGKSRRVLRGGSWNIPRGFARAAVRNHNHPGDRDSYLGFRLVRLSPIFE